MSVADIYDFRGGYATDVPDALMPDNMCLKAQNTYYYGGFINRPGVKTGYTAGVVLAEKSVNLSGSWVRLIVRNESGTIHFYTETGGTLTEIDASYTWTQSGSMVASIDAQGNTAVICHGNNYPAVVYYTDDYYIENIETYDTRTRTTDDWYAGQYDASASPPYIDETSEAQAETGTTFDLATTTNGDGFYVAGVLTFNKVAISSCPQFDGSPVAVYEYYAGNGTWTSFTPTTAPSWTAASGTKTLEFDLPFDSDGNLLWEAYGDLDSQDDATGVADGTFGALTRYMIRVRFTTAPTSAQQSGYLTVYHTQYLRQIMANEKPTLVKSYLNRFYLGSGNTAQISEYASLKGWQDYNVEYFNDGGDAILAFAETSQYLAVFKSDLMYSITGNSFDTRVVNVQQQIGTSCGTSVASDRDRIFFSTKQGIYMLVSDTPVLVSKHIRSELSATGLGASHGCFYKGLYYWSGDGVNIVTDPDSFKLDDSGDGLVAWYRWTGFTPNLWIPNGGEDDSSNLRFFTSSDSKVYELDSTQAYDLTNTAIAVDFRYKRFNAGVPQRRKSYTKLKIETNKCGNLTLTAVSNEGEVSRSATYDSGSGIGNYSKFLSMYGKLDGRSLELRLSHSALVAFELHGFSLEYQQRAN